MHRKTSLVPYEACVFVALLVLTNIIFLAFTNQLKGYEHVTAQCHNCKFDGFDWFEYLLLSSLHPLPVSYL